MIVHVSKDRPPITFVIEPWGRDITALPGDEFEIIPCEYMVVGETDIDNTSMTIWLEYKDKRPEFNFCDAEFKATVNGKAVDCGHNREHSDGRWSV